MKNNLLGNYISLTELGEIKANEILNKRRNCEKRF